LTSFILWPSQSVTVYKSNSGAWAVPQASKWVYASAPTIFVDPVNGSDTSNDGLSTGTAAMQTISGAFNLATKNFQGNGGTITIQLADGTYTTANPLFNGGQTGAFLFSIGGAPGHGASVIMQKGFSVKDFVAVGFNEMTFNSVSGSAINADQSGIVDVNSTVTFGSGASMSPMSATNGGTVNIDGAMTFSGGSLNIGFIAQSGGKLNFNTSTINVSAAVAFGTCCAFANTNALISAQGVTFSGAGVAGTTGQRYLALTGGGIDTGGGGASYFPGSSAGSATSPAWITPP
jgi:hypothetical protein